VVVAVGVGVPGDDVLNLRIVAGDSLLAVSAKAVLEPHQSVAQFVARASSLVAEVLPTRDLRRLGQVLA
jgi:hypothetical protein